MVVEPTEFKDTTAINEKRRAECWERFLDAVREARKNNFRPGNRLIRSVHERFGDAAAEIQRKELKAYVESEKKA